MFVQIAWIHAGSNLKITEDILGIALLTLFISVDDNTGLGY